MLGPKQLPWKTMVMLAALAGGGLGLAAGVGGYTFFYANGLSYMTDDPSACANCHVMHEQYDAWHKSSHRAVATCNDCHTPHSFLGKYFTKGLNGYHHSMAFTLGNFQEPIQIKPRNRAITEQTCRNCHQDIVQAIDRHPSATDPTGEPLSCIRCHNSVGHLH